MNQERKFMNCTNKNYQQESRFALEVITSFHEKSLWEFHFYHNRFCLVSYQIRLQL
jgi:hypothetical protein